MSILQTRRALAAAETAFTAATARRAGAEQVADALAAAFTAASLAAGPLLAQLRQAETQAEQAATVALEAYRAAKLGPADTTATLAAIEAQRVGLSYLHKAA